jgi:hypothetical protein
MRSLLLVESFDLRPRNQYILVRVISSCFRFAKICLCQASLLSRCSPRYFTFSWESWTLFMWTEGHVSLRVGNVTWTDLHPLAFILHFLNQFWIAGRLGPSFFEAMAGSLALASIAVSSAKVAVVFCGEFDRFAMYNRYNNDPRTLPWSTPILSGMRSVYCLNLWEEVSAMQTGFYFYYYYYYYCYWRVLWVRVLLWCS